MHRGQSKVKEKLGLFFFYMKKSQWITNIITITVYPSKRFHKKVNIINLKVEIHRTLKAKANLWVVIKE